MQKVVGSNPISRFFPLACAWEFRFGVGRFRWRRNYGRRAEISGCMLRSRLAAVVVTMIGFPS